MSLTKKIRGFYISCQQELFPCVEQNYGGGLNDSGSCCCYLRLVCVEDHLPRPRPRAVGRPLAHRVMSCVVVLGQDGVNYS